MQRITWLVVVVLLTVVATTASAAESPGGAESHPGFGPDSISGSFVEFNPAAGGDNCYEPTITQTFCFRAEAYTSDGEWPTVLTLSLPDGWTATDVSNVGPSQCEGGGTIAPVFEWWPYYSPNEIIISHTWQLATTDHCWTTYCVEATTVDTGSQANVSWYWYVENPAGSSPHTTCSSDGYTPWLAPPCEEALQPLATIPACLGLADLGVTKSTTDPWTAGMPGTVQITVTNSGPASAVDVTVLDPALNGITFQGFAAYDAAGVPITAWACDAGVACVRSSPMPPSTTEVLVLSETLPSGMVALTGHNAVNDAFVAADNPDPAPANNSARYTYVVDGSVTLSVDKTALASELVAGGEEALYRILTHNAGPSDAYGLVVTDTVDAGLTLLALEPGPAGPMTCADGRCVLEVLPAGETYEVYARVAAPATTAAGTYTNTACAVSTLVYSGGPGTGAPPPDLGPYLMTPFPADGRPMVNVTTVPGPTGDLTFDRAMGHRRIGVGWSTWSHGYTGDVYYSLGATSVVMTLPANTGAFYFYVEPNPFAWVTIQAMAQDGTTSGPVSVNGSSGARYFGFYSLGGAPLTTITVTGASDFAVGEFGIAGQGLGTVHARACGQAALPVVTAADLALTKTGPVTVTAGSLLTYTVTVFNNGPSDAQNVVLTDTLPYGVTPVSPLTFNLGTLPAGGTATVTVVGQSDANACYAGSVGNRAWVTSATPDPDPANNDDAWSTVILNDTTLTLVKGVSPTPAVAGGTVDFALTVSNTGPGCASSVTVVDALGAGTNPPGLALVDYDATQSTQGAGPLNGRWYTCSAGVCQRAAPMLPGTTDTITLTLRVPAASGAGSYRNDADVVWDSGGATTFTNWSVTAQADLGVQKAVIADEICLGASGFYELVVTNAGPSDAQSVTVSDALPAGLVYGGGSPECSAAGGTVTCALPALAAGARYDFLLGFTLAPGVVNGTAIANTATVTSATAEPAGATLPNSDDATFTAVQCSLPETDVQVVSKTLVNPPAVPGGGNLRFDIVVRNNGPHAAEGVTLVDSFFDVDYTLEDTQLPGPTGTWYCSSGLTCVRQTAMAAGTVETLTLWVSIPPGATASAFNRASVVADNPDPTIGNNTALVEVQFQSQASLTIAKVGMPDPVTAGGTLLYELQVTNTGPSVAYAVVVTDTLPPGTTFAEAGPGCAATGGVVTCALGDLPLNVPRSVFVTVRVDSSLPGGSTLQNQACVSDTANAVDNTPVCATNQVLVQAPASTAADLELTQSVVSAVPAGTIWGGSPFGEGHAVAGGHVQYEIVVHNAGPVTATDVVVYDQLPYRFTYAGALFTADYAPAGPFACTPQTCALGAIPAGRVVTITLDVNVESNAPLSSYSGTLVYNNTVVVQAASADPDTADNYDQAGVTVEPLVDLNVEKLALPNPAVPGEDVTYQIQVYNAGPSDLHWDPGQLHFGDYDELYVFDALPAQIDPATVSVAAGGYTGPCASTGGVLECILDLPALHQAVITVRGRVLPGVTAPFSNTVYAQDHFETETVSATVRTLVAPAADLSIVKTAPATANAGEQITYTLAVRNAGPSHATGVTITDTLPGGVTLDSASTGCALAAGGTVVCGVGTLAPGAQATATLVVRVDSGVEPGASLENTALVGAITPEADAADNQDTADTSITGLADLALDKHGPATVIAGEALTYTIVVTNAGPSVAQSVEVAEALPAEVALVAASFSAGATAVPCSGPICYLGDMAPSRSFTVTVIGQASASLPAGAVLVNRATVVSDTPDGDVANNAGEASTTVSTAADLAVDLADLADPVEPLEGFLYQVNVANHGSSDAHDVVVVDTLGAGLSFSTASPGCTGQPGGQVVTCTLGILAAGERTFFLVAVTAGDVPSGTVLLNDVTVASATADPDGLNNTDQETTTVWQDFGPSADLSLVKTATPPHVVAGDLVTYTLTITNAGPMAATGVEVLEMIPAGTEAVSIAADNPDFGYEFCILSGACYLGTVYPNTTVATVTVVLRVDRDYQGTSITNIASVSGDQADYDPDDNYGSAVVAVTPLDISDLSLHKNAPATARAGGLITYTLTVMNLGPNAAADVVITDTLPAEVTLAWTGAGCAPATGGATCTASIVPAGQVVTFTLGVIVDASVEPGSALENVAVVGSSAIDPNAWNNTGSAHTSITGWTDLSLDKTGPEEIPLGGVVTYTIIVVNAGPSAAQSVQINDSLPQGIAFLYAALERGGIQTPCGAPVCQAGDMIAGETVTVTVVGRAALTFRGGEVLTNTATVQSDTPEDNLANNTDIHPAPVRAFALFLPFVSDAFEMRSPGLPAPAGVVPDTGRGLFMVRRR